MQKTIYKLDHNNTYNGDIIPMWDSESKEKAILELKEKHKVDADKCVGCHLCMEKCPKKAIKIL